MRPGPLPPPGWATLLVDTHHETLVNKLCALLGSLKIMDLVGVAPVLEASGDLTRALRDAPRKDAGFSAPTLARALSGPTMADLSGAGRR